MGGYLMDMVHPAGNAGVPPISLDSNKPYKGAESYQVEDAALFCGRAAEAEQVTARILSSRFTLLHAQSGAGKTSLLNACVIPNLEQRGWFPIRIRPENDPIAATRNATLHYLLPPPGAEAYAIRRAQRLLGLEGADTTVGSLLSAYDAIAPRDPIKRAAIAPVFAADIAALHPDATGQYTPYTCRVLRSSVDLQRASEQWNLVLELTGRGVPVELAEDLPLSAIVPVLESEDYRNAHSRLLEFLDPPGQCRLCDFFDNLIQVYGARLVRFGLVLLYDQFEEIFTRFVDAGKTDDHRSDVQDWRLRWALMEEIRQIYTYRMAPPLGSDGEGAELPLRFVISMRSEYIAGLEPLRGSVPGLDQCAYALQMLNVDQASQAIKAPAKMFGYGYSEKCYEQVIADLTKEERFVEPAHLQMVCEYLWNHKGRELSARDEKAQAGQLPEVPLKDYEDGDGLRGIMSAFLWGYLNGLDLTGRLECLEMLERLITSSDTRNIVEYSALIRAPLRDEARREELLAGLVRAGIVRAESRLRGRFVEITHEFLIAPIRSGIRDNLTANPVRRQMLQALEAMQRALQLEMGVGEATVQAWEFEVLDQCRDELVWDDASALTMFRNAIAHGARAASVRHWAHRVDLAQGGQPGAAETVVHGYLAATDPSTRKKGLSAAAALCADGLADELVDAALADPSPQLRSEAEAMIAKEIANPALAGELQRRFDVPADRAKVYALAGRLRLRGATPSLRLDSPIRSLRDALGLIATFRRGRGWRYYLRGFAPGLIGGICGAALWFMLLGALNLAVDQVWVFSLVFGFLLFPVAALSVPSVLQYHRGAGIASACLVAMALDAIYWGVLATAVTSAEKLELHELLTLLVQIAVTRATAATVGGSLGRPYVDTPVTALVSGCAGILAAVPMSIAWNEFAPISDRSSFDAFWAIALPLGAMFAVLDSLPTDYQHIAPKSPCRAWPQPTLGRGAGHAVIAFVSVAMFALLYVSRPLDVNLETPLAQQTKSEPVSLKPGMEPVTLTPTADLHAYTLDLAQGGSLNISLTSTHEEAYLYKLRLLSRTDDSGRVVSWVGTPVKPVFTMNQTDTNESSTQELKGGQYMLEIVPDHSSLEGTDLMTQLRARAYARMGLTQQPEYAISVALKMQPPAPAAPRSRPKP